MSYEIFIESGDIFKIGCCEFDSFLNAKSKVSKMIIDLMVNLEEDDFGTWDKFKNTFPEEIRSIIESFEQTGSAPTAKSFAEGDIDDYHYYISDDKFEIRGKENREYCPVYALQTDMLGMNGENGNYFFRIWSGRDFMKDEAIIIHLKRI